MGKNYVIKRPGNPAQMKELLKKGESVPLEFTPSLILEYYNAHLPENEKAKSIRSLTPHKVAEVIEVLLKWN
jgi:hypothetical protein